MKEVDFVNKDGETIRFEGVSFASLFDSAGVDEYENCILVAADGYSADVTYDELNECVDCIVAFQEKDGLRAVMPGFSGKLQVKDLIEIKIKK
jgi:hypothetical protein